ncbi:hypothetical protein DPX16_12536 [Anabarilius grahami]|uniref:Uncharacterized protein n=1 Tax=Anabarilius grahami TaxID=495550 RepID=A0A3N0XR94_ANAGA|nr:hypothetical protein DPX16_12536 [Anabarilius grahami]
MLIHWLEKKALSMAKVRPTRELRAGGVSLEKELWLEYFHQIKEEGNFDGSFLDKNLYVILFPGLNPDLDSTKDTWNSHLIRPSRNSLIPHGRPDVMYTLPELYDTEDYICHILVEDCATCEDQCIHRSDVACDEDIFTLCAHIMAQHHLRLPKDMYTALDLLLLNKS